jgi:hypothetical protein
MKRHRLTRSHSPSRFAALRLALCVVIVAAALGGTAQPARADGGHVHHEIIHRAYDLLDKTAYPDLGALLAAHAGAFEAGVVFPDFYYLMPLEYDFWRHVSDLAHGTAFELAYMNVVRAAFQQHSTNPADLDALAFLFGLLSHNAADNPWHYDWACDPGTPAFLAMALAADPEDGHTGVELGANVFVAYESQYDHRPEETWVLPVPYVQAAYAALDPPVTVPALGLTQGMQEFGAEHTALLGIDWLAYYPYTIALVWTHNNLETYPCGGINDGAQHTVSAWEDAWKELVPPQANAQTVATAEDTPLAVTLTAADPDGDHLTYEVVAPPANGTLSGTAPDLVYTPAADFNGSDSFTFWAAEVMTNGVTLEGSNVATVTITIDPVNDVPVADSLSVATDEDAPLAFTLTGSDVEADPLTFEVVAPPANGTLSGTAPDLTYTPAADFNGADSFTFRVNDGAADSDVAEVSITVNPVNDVPIADSLSVTTDEDTPLDVTLTGSDVEGSPLAFAVVASPAHGTLSGAAPNLTYTPAADFNGADSFTFQVNDGALDSGAATVSIAVGAVNETTFLPMIGR